MNVSQITAFMAIQIFYSVDKSQFLPDIYYTLKQVKHMATEI